MTDLKTVEQRLFWLSHWMIHHANHIRPEVDAIKTGGHQALSAAMVSILTALYFSAPRPGERVAVTFPVKAVRGEDRPPGVGQCHADQGCLPIGNLDSLRSRFGTPQTSTGSGKCARESSRRKTTAP